MSEADHIEVPLFPLPNVVLFPHVLLPLHIFEERYKTMINACVEEGSPFGVVLFSGGEEKPSNIRKIGVLARVTRVERLEDGRLNILSEGEARFRIIRFSRQEPFWQGVVELVDEQPEPESALGPLRQEMAALYLEAYRKGVELTGERPGELRLPTSALDLSFMVTYVLDMDSEEKQRLLEMTSTRERLSVLIRYVRDANERLDQQIHKKRTAETARGNGDLGHPGRGSG